MRCSLSIKIILFIISGLLPVNISIAGESSVLQSSEPRAVLRVIHSERLRQIMQRLDSLAYEREHTALDLQYQRERQVRRLITATRELVEKSEQLPALVDDTNISPEDLTIFRAMAAQLYQKTRDLEQSLHRGHKVSVREGYQNLRETCNACHRLFRQDGGGR